MSSKITADEIASIIKERTENFELDIDKVINNDYSKFNKTKKNNYLKNTKKRRK